MGRNGTTARETRLRNAAMKKALEALRRGASTRKAAEAAGVSRASLQTWCKQFPAFAEEWQQAMDDGTDLLEDIVLNRAVDGWEEPVFQGGRQVGTVTKFDHTLLLRTLEMRRPDRWRANHRVEHTGAGGGPVEVDLKGLRDVLASRLDALAERRAAAG